jgi:hypothetical protein
VKWAALAVAIVGVLAVLWLAGEQHRKNCEDAGKVSCSVLPWDNGKEGAGSRQGGGWRGQDPGGWRGESHGGWR